MKRWPLYNPWFWETAPFFRALLPLAAGIFCYGKGWLTFISEEAFLAIIVISFGLYGLLVYNRKNAATYKSITVLLLHFVLFCSGFSLAWFNDDSNAAVWFGKGTNPSKTYLARITETPAEKESSWKIPVAIIYSIDNGKVQRVNGKAFLYLYKGREPILFQKGDSILVPGDWQPIKNPGNPFEFDYAAYCRRNNIVYEQFCQPQDTRLYATNDPRAAPLTERTHDWCMAQLDKYITGSKAKGLIQAMLIGDEVNLDENLRQSYSNTGIIHIIAISGGNVSIFFLVISFLLRWLKHKKYRWIKYFIALPLVWFYVLMAGASPSAIRAAVMFSLLAFGIIFGKNNSSLNLLFATAFVLLCTDPGWLFALGFQLSFIAVLSIILFYKPIYRWFTTPYKLIRLLWGTIAASMAAEILVAPVVVWYFHMLPLFFIIANAAAFLFMGAVLILGIALLVISPFEVIAKAMGMVIEWLVTIFDKMIASLQTWNPESFQYLMLTGLELLIVYVIITGLSVFLLKKQKSALFTSLAASSLLFALLCCDEWTALRQQKLVVFNTSKANHIELIKGERYTILQTDTTVPAKKISYAVKPAHTVWHAWRASNNTPNQIYQVRNSTALILNRSIDTGSTFHTDYLIVNTPVLPDPELLKQVFSPTLVVLGSKYRSQLRDKFMHDAAKAGIAVHSTSLSGAFQLSE